LNALNAAALQSGNTAATGTANPNAGYEVETISSCLMPPIAFHSEYLSL